MLKFLWWGGFTTLIPILILKKRCYLSSYIYLLLLLLWIMFTTSNLPERLGLVFISSRFSAMLTFIPLILFFSLFLLFLYEIISPKYNYIITIIIIITTLLSGIWRLDKYLHAKKRSVVKDDDMKAFEWINKNIKDNKFFIGRVEFAAGTSFLTDASLYLPYFCNKDILLNYVSSDNFNRDNKEDIKLYKSLIENFGDTEIIEKIVQKNIKYIFLSKKPVFGDGGINNNTLEKYSYYYRKIYDNKGTTIWEITY